MGGMSVVPTAFMVSPILKIFICLFGTVDVDSAALEARNSCVCSCGSWRENMFFCLVDCKFTRFKCLLYRHVNKLLYTLEIINPSEGLRDIIFERALV